MFPVWIKFCLWLVLIFITGYATTSDISETKRDNNPDIISRNERDLDTFQHTIVKIPPYKDYTSLKIKPRYRIKRKFYKKRVKSKKVRRIKRISGRHHKWSHSVWLGETGDSPKLSWNPKHRYVEFNIVANTIGSIKLTFDSVDHVELWVDDHDNKVYLKDYFLINSTAKPVEDVVSSYTIIDGAQTSTHTDISFRRSWDTCDVEDVPLGGDSVRISWSIHPHDPGDEINHNNWSLDDEDNIGVVRGTRSLLLQTPIEQELPKYQHQHWDVLMKNVIVPDDMTTQYWCKIFRSPYFGKRNHIIAYEPMILSNASNFVHHMLLYECNSLSGYLDSYSSLDHPGTQCYSSDMPKDWATCVRPVATWVIGGGTKVLPPHIGLPIGPGQTYYMLEIHYDNLGLKKVVDNSGFRLYYTDQLRMNEGGVFMTGVTVSPLHIIPPGQDLYRNTGLCNNACTEKSFPDNGINIVSVLLHSHLAGRAMRLRHVRGDREMSVIAQDQKYDYNYQVDRMLNEEVKIYPGDHFITECDYSTMDRQNITWGGYSTREEMCLSFILYYPRTELAACQSITPVSYFFDTLGIKSFYNYNMNQIRDYLMRTAPIPKTKHETTTTEPPPLRFSGTDEEAIAVLKKMPDYIIDGGSNVEDSFLLNLIIKEPSEFKNRTLIEHLLALPWSDMLLTKAVEDGLNKGLQMVFCRQSNDHLAVPLTEISFPNFTVYKPQRQNDCLVPKSHHSSSSHNILLPVIFYFSFICFVIF